MVRELRSLPKKSSSGAILFKDRKIPVKGDILPRC